MFRRIALVLLILLVPMLVFLQWVTKGGLGSHEAPGTPTDRARAATIVAETEARVSRAAQGLGVARPKQILFGDLHVHTTFSFDAFMISLPLISGEGAHPPADACDYARFCSALDFWSINDHAEGITQEHWRETVQAIRTCNEIAGHADTPDTVAFLGWEWSQVGTTPDTHYGHKNVVLRDTEDGKIPARPIAALGTYRRTAAAKPFPPILGGAFLLALGDARFHDFARFFAERDGLDVCPEGVPVRELPLDCIEAVDSPDLLFDKLDDWGVESLVIPHGTTWGFYTPAGSTWDKQLEDAYYDDGRQKLFEIYSGHGNAELYRDFREVLFDSAGQAVCPERSAGYLPRCVRAGELIEARCLTAGADIEECRERAAVARQNAAEALVQAHLTVPGASSTDWLDAGQCLDCEQGAFNYRPGGAAQYVMALSNFDERGEDGRPRRFRFGFMGSSDNHFGRPGTGYKELHRKGFTESSDRTRDINPRLTRALQPAPEEPVPFSRPYDAGSDTRRGFALFELERQSSYFMTGGLIAAHAQGRDRGAIWDALQRREVYGTTGPRFLLWFDLLNAPGGTDGTSVPMGGAVEMADAPIFQARAVGSFEQQPGCPEDSARALGSERLELICKGECYHPSDVRRPISRIEVVRVRPQANPGEPVADLIDDPWRVFPCDPDPAGCAVTFQDPAFATLGRDTLYYVRAYEPPTPAINAAGVNCERDAAGRCVEPRPCGTDPSSNCLAEHEPRAWSSPIFVDHPAARSSH